MSVSSSSDMTKPTAMTNVPAPEPRHESWKTVLPSWFLSACVHATIAVLLIWFLRPQTSGGLGDDDADFRNVGLYVVPAEQETETETESETESDEETLEPPASASLLSKSKLPQEMPTLSDVLPVDLPDVKEQTRILGPGKVGNPLASGSSDPDGLIRPNGKPNSLSGAPNQGQSAAVKFFGAEGQGSRFVYVIDSSSSMAEFGAMRMAKAQLMTSLGQIQGDQEFQIVFYNTEYRSLTVGNKPAQLMPATAINRTLARQFIDAVQPNGGTNHKPAIELALSFKPDVIFLLTDAGQPILTPRDLQTIKQINRGKATIHTVAFGDGVQLQSNDSQADNFLQKLARQNGGSYVYRDVREFQRR